ncbi:hypothetical protein ACE1CD_03765 [Aerosakkonema sp. BLCC-F183]|uniref:hypothetical protein n=1 Tax=Aerosakkonema sp. BLCC-F183 TaxID=3342834 RepID=UPI0035B76139
MKLNSTVALTLVLLVLMLGAGLVSGMWGFALGHEALKGVSQPDARPTAKTKNYKETPAGTQPLVMLKEADIIKSVNVRKQGKGKQAKADKNDEPSEKRTKSLSPSESTPSTATNAAFPIVTKDKGVTLEIRSVQQQQGSLLLDVSLKNEGDQPVKFLYSFLDVTDNRGRPLSASAEGLPGELPPNGESFSGTVSIPTSVLEGADRLSLTLTDYPDQQLRLQTSEIPVR